MSKYIFQNFVEQDNKKIISIIKRLFIIYYRCSKIKIQNYFFEYLKAVKNCQNFKCKKGNVYNKLYNESKIREKLISELEQKFNQNEEEICTFSPKINTFENKLLSNNDSLFNNLLSKSLSKINSNENKRNKSQNIINKTNTIKILNNFRNTNSFFYKGQGKSKINENEYKNKNNRRNDFRELQMMNNYNTNKDIIPINYNKLIDKNYEEQSKYLVLNSFNKDINYGLHYYNIAKKINDKKILNDENNNVQDKAHHLIKRNKSHKIKKKNKINEIEIDNKDKDTSLKKIKDFMKINQSRNKLNKSNSLKIKYKKENLSYNEKHYLNENQKIVNNLLKKFKSNRNRNLNEIEKKIKNSKLSQSNLKKKKLDNMKYKYSKYISEKNSENQSKTKSIMNTYIDIDKSHPINEKEIEKNENKKKGINYLQKNNSIYSNFINPIRLYNFNDNKEICNNKFITAKNDNSLNSAIINNRIHSCFLANKSNKKGKNLNATKEAYSINEIEDNCINDMNNNKAPFKLDYFYTLRNKKIPYNSFNYFSNTKSIANTSKNNVKLKSYNILNNNNNKDNLEINNKTISLLEKTNEKINPCKIYPVINKINSIYLKNYDKKNCVLNINKNNLRDRYIYGYVKPRPSIITNITNNETKGCSVSTISTKDNQIYNSKRNSKNNIINKKDIISGKENENDNQINIGNFIIDYKSSKKNDKKIIKNNELVYNNNNNLGNKDFVEFKMNRNVDAFYKNYKNNKSKEKKLNEKKDKSMTLQSLSDSKMLDLAEHYINTSNDGLDDIGIKKIVFKKNKNEK